MYQRGLTAIAATGLAIALATDPAAAKEGGAAANHPSNEIQARVASNYIALPRVHVPVEVDANRQFRALDLEVWLLPKGPEDLAKARSAKKVILETLRDDLAGYNWEAFQDSQGGPEVAKRVVAESVTRASGVHLADVLIKTLLLK